jgi:hypothetical protein
MIDNTFDFGMENAAGLGNKPVPMNDFSAAFNQMNSETSDRMLSDNSRPMSLMESLNAPVGPKTMTYVPNSAVDMFRYQEGFKSQYFNPLDTSNYEKWADKETFGSALNKGFDSFGHKFGNTFIDYWKGYGRMADALVHMDWDRMRPDEATLADQYYKDQIDMNKNFVFEKPENEDSILSKRTMSEFIGNAGFALGTFAGIGLEIAADVAITFLSGGAGVVSFGGTAAKLAATQTAKQAAKSGFRFADALTDIGKGFSYGNKSAEEISAASKVIANMDEASAIANGSRSALRDSMGETFSVFTNHLFNITKSKNFSEVSANLLKSTPLLGTGIRSAEKLAAASRAGATTGELIGVGLQGARRVAQELNMSATEASFEAVTSYGDTLDKMAQQYKIDNNGAVPSPEEFEEMRKLAISASSANYNTNMALLLATNKIQFGNLFNRFVPANKYMNEVAENLLVVEGKAGTGIFRKDGFLGAYGLIGKVGKEFGKKEAAYQFSKAFAKDFLKFQVSEGIQENMQETSAAAWKDYYAGQFNSTEMSLSEAFGEGASQQFTKQGLKTFLMGALTGSLISIPTSITSKSLEAANRAVINRQYANNPGSNPLIAAEAQLDKNLDILNTSLKQLKEGKFKDKVFNFSAQIDAAQEQAESASKGLRYEFENGKDNALLAAVASAQKTNSIDVLYRAVKSMGQDMTNEDFEKSFGVKLEDTKYRTPSEFSEAVAKDIKKYSDTMEGIRTKVKSQLADPFEFAEGSRNRYVATLLRSAQEDAIQVLSMNAIKGDMSAKRAKQVADDLLSIPGMSRSSDFALRVLTNPGSIEGEIGNLLGEIKILRENIEAEGIEAQTKKELKEQLSLKLEEYELIEKWKGYWENRQVVVGTNEDDEEVTKESILDIFKGKTIEKTQTVKDENGNDVETVDRTYDPTDPEVIETFRQLMNIKNRQSGSNEVISEASMRDGFQKIYDYIRLDRDTKDYMRSVDVLSNPENLRITLGRMADGKFKHNLINHVDPLLKQAELAAELIIIKLGIVNENDRRELFNEMLNTVYESENWKNLTTLISNPDLGVANEDYAQKTYSALIKEILKKEQELTLKYSPKEYNNDISQEDYDKIIVEGKIDTTTKYLIAAKLSNGTKLSELEQKVYDIHKLEIDKEVDLPSDANTPIAADTTTIESGVTAETIIEDEIPEAIIPIPYIDENGEISEDPAETANALKADIERRRKEEYAKIDAKYSEQIEAWEKKRKENIERTGLAGDTRALDALKGLVYNAKQKVDEILNKELDELDTIEDKKEDIKNALDYILTGRYNGKAGRKRQSTEVGEKIAQKIATGLSNQGLIKQDGKLFSTLEGDNLGVAWSVGKYFAEEFKNGFEAELAALNTPGLSVQASTETIPSTTTTNMVDVISENENLPGEFVDESFFGITPTEPVIEEEPVVTQQETPFAPQGNLEEGYDVVDINNNSVNPEKFKSEEEAAVLAESLNSTRVDLDFVKSFLGALPVGTETEMTNKMLEIGLKSMNAYNKRKGTSHATLEEYYNTGDGRFLLEANREALLTGKPVNYNRKKAKVSGLVISETQVPLFETPSTGRATSLTLQSLETLYAKVLEFRKEAAENSNNFSKFVETEKVAQTPVTESSIINKLQEISNCFS